MPATEFTFPVDDPETACEQWHRYQFASLFVAGKRVLDVACGEGYGASFLARQAKAVVGVNFDTESVQHASSKYVVGNLTFLAGHPTKIPVSPDHAFDVVVSFDTLENIDRDGQRAFLAEVKRLLTPGGLFLVSTPNKLVGAADNGSSASVRDASATSDGLCRQPTPWPFFYCEFKDFLSDSFQHVVPLGQGFETGSYIDCLANEQNALRAFCLKHSHTGYGATDEQRQARYFLAVCSDSDIPKLPSSLSLDLSRRITLARNARIAELQQSVAEIAANLAERDQVIEALKTQIAEGDRAIEMLMAQLNDGDCRIETLTAQMADRDSSVESLRAKLAQHDKSVAASVAERDRIIGSLSNQIAEITRSKAWRLVSLLRKVRLSLAPPRTYRARTLRRLATTALLPYRKLKARRSTPAPLSPAPASAPVSAEAPLAPVPAELRGAASPQLVNIDSVPACLTAPGRVAIHLHLIHAELAHEFAGYFHNIPFPFDLYVSVSDRQTRETCVCTFSELPLCQKLKVEMVPNRGRDIAPMFCAFGKELMGYQFFAHVHGGQSRDADGGSDNRREYLCTSLFGSDHRIRQIFALLSGHEPAGIVYPQTHDELASWENTWLANRSMGVTWCKRLGVARVPRGYFDYPVGSMFWARCDALAPMFKANITREDFPREAGQRDGTLAHCLERLPVLVARQQGFRHAVIRDTRKPNWSSWRLDRYSGLTQKPFKDLLADPDVRVVAFDIFDTLLCRPLLDPEAVKEIVARRATVGMGELYRQFRSKAEIAAREHTGLDVGLDAIYEQFPKLSGVSREEANTLKQLEEDVERHSVTPRADGVSLMKTARKAGKRVILISDMFLPRALIESILEQHGISDWDAIYLSNDVGLRKDTGDLYGHVLDKEGLLPKQIVMVGDNERVDIQIPSSMGIRTFHVLRPVETARALPRLSPIVEKVEHDDDLDHQLTMGLVVRRVFSPIFHQDMDPASLLPATPLSLGYSVIGPLMAGFVHWLVNQARHDGIDRLHFLSREGKAIKLAYDRWNEAFHIGPPSEYLVLSRRSTTVPAITTLKDILTIARTDYSANSARCFLDERFGLDLSAERWNELYRQNRWSADRQVEVWGGQIGADVIQLLHAVQDDIFAQVASERPALNAYLRKMGLDGSQRAAVVDVGYSATVQDRLNLLLGKQVHGYYMMTAQKANTIRDRHGCIVRGCFVDGANTCQGLPPLYLNSFTLEKMLGSTEGQVVRYLLQDGGDVLGVHRPMSKTEREGNQARLDIRKGMLDYIDDVVHLRKNLFPDFQPPLTLADELFVAFSSNLSAVEKSITRTLVLDDYYCGQGLL